MFFFIRLLRLFTAIIFVTGYLCPVSLAQPFVAPSLGGMSVLGQPGASCLLRGVKVDANNPLDLDFLFDEGQELLPEQAFNDETLHQIKYFMASLTIPEKDLWVNLSPLEQGRIVQEDLGRTGMGRDLLGQDYVLKQLTASLLHPDDVTGKAFWAEVYRKTYAKYGTTDVPLGTFNKVWIVPGGSVVYEALSPDKRRMSAFVDELKLKVLMESDYLAANHAAGIVEQPGKPAPLQDLSKEVMTQIVIPVLEREVNQGESFAPLRRICHALVLSIWLKKKLLASAQQANGLSGGNILSTTFVNRHKTNGIEIMNPKAEIAQIYDGYVQAYTKGAHDLIREEVDLYSKEIIPRRYFSGGFSGAYVDKSMQIKKGYPLKDDLSRNLKDVKAKFQPSLKPQPSKVELGFAVVVLGFMFAASAWYGGNWMQQRPIDYINVSPKTGEDADQKKAFEQARLEPATHPLALKDVEEKILDQKQDISDISKQKDLNSIRIMELAQIITENLQRYESALAGQPTPSISVYEFFKKVLNKPVQKVASNGNLQDTEKLATELGGIIERNFNQFGSDLKVYGLKPIDMAKLLFSMIMKESGGDMRAEQWVGGKLQARGALQVEYVTWWNKIQIAENELKNMPLEFRGFYKRIQDERKNLRGDLSKNKWTSNAAGDMVVTPEEHIRMAIIWINNMMKYAPEPVGSILNAVDRQFIKDKNITAPRKIVDALQDQEPLLSEVVNKLTQDPVYASYDKNNILMMLLAAKWNGGINRTWKELEYILKIATLTVEQRIKHQKNFNVIFMKAEARKYSSRIRLIKFISKEFQNRMDVDKLFASSSDRGVILARWYNDPAVTDAQKKKFLSLWWEYRLFEKDALEAQWQQRVWKSAIYAVICSTLGQFGLDQTNLNEEGMAFRAHRKLGQGGLDLAKNAVYQEKERLAKEERLAQEKIRRAKAKQSMEENKRRVKDKVSLHPVDRQGNRSKKDHGQSVYGGIDLTEQAAMMVSRGQAGAFRFDLSPDALRMAQDDIDGFLPLIVHVEAIKDAAMFLKL